MRIARIARPDAMYDASVAAQTFETIGEAIIYPNGFAVIVDVNWTNEMGNISNVITFYVSMDLGRRPREM